MKRMTALDSRPPDTGASGIAFLVPAYLIWGLSPLYWKLVDHVNSFELLLHRTIWSLAFLVLIIFLQKRGRELANIMKSPALMASLAGTTLILALNWYLFIWAINHEHILQASLAYYMNPLITVLLGMVFFSERLSRMQLAALVTAGAGVVYYTVFLGEFPWISVTIAVTFAVYSLLHKLMPVLPLPGLLIETLILSVPSAGWLILLGSKGGGAMLHNGAQTDRLLVGTCLVTGLPLLIFTIGTKRSSLTTVGFLQYIAPCCSFLLAVLYFREPFSSQKLVAFIMIWAALAIYSMDSIVAGKRQKYRS